MGIALDQSRVDVLDHLVVVIAHHGGDLRAGLLEGLAVFIIVALEDLFAGALCLLYTSHIIAGGIVSTGTPLFKFE